MAGLENLSVVVVSLLGGDALRACLSRIDPTKCECIVVFSYGAPSTDNWSSRFPSVRFITPRHPSVPLRRLQGALAATRKIVSFLEDTSLPGTGWCEAVCEAFEDHTVGGAGGPIEIASTLPARYKALGCSEFGRFHPLRYRRLAAGPRGKAGIQPVCRLPGNNLAYLRDLLLDVTRDPDKGVFETEVNDAIRARRMQIVMHPGMCVTYIGIDRHGARLSTRMSHGRLFASGCVVLGGANARLIGLAKSLALPVVLSVRSLSNARSAVGPKAFPIVAVWLCAMEAFWALGEGIGYLAGAGNSMESWR